MYFFALLKPTFPFQKLQFFLSKVKGSRKFTNTFMHKIVSSDLGIKNENESLKVL